MSEGKKKSTRKPLRQKVKELEEELEEKKEKMMRLLADFDNYRKRMEKEVNELAEKEKEKLLLRFLEVYENLQMACKEIENEGLQMVMNQFKKALNDEGIEEINALGEKFDYNLHHAVATKKSKEKDGIIIEEIKKGYMLNGRVIRPSYVIVAKGDGNGEDNRN
ncbi:nucleotide exchange factor GrpE [Thermoplasmatales archaeon ex4484_30]|nr:MAG: nucleotide exchange factor GrpE [Thermoplasmatales archaeon ex4484_30]